MTQLARHEIGRTQAAALRNAGWTQAAIARAISVSEFTLRRYLREGSPQPRTIARHVDAARHTAAPRAWRDRALCRGEDPELFFPESTDILRQEAARAVCVLCPVMQTCGNWAIDNGITNGVFGGLTEEEREQIRSTRVAEAA